MPIHDLHCTRCDWEKENQAVVAGQYPPCPVCSAPTDWTPSGFATDVKGQTTTNTLGIRDKNGELVSYTSTREQERKMKALGYSRSPLADKHGGSREGNAEKYHRHTVPDHNATARRLSREEGKQARGL